MMHSLAVVAKVNALAYVRFEALDLSADVEAVAPLRD
jgi:hypothetical protein